LQREQNAKTGKHDQGRVRTKSEVRNLATYFDQPVADAQIGDA